MDLRATNSGSNRRHMVTIDGITRNLVEWERASGIPRNIIRHRLNRGWEPRLAVFTDMVRAKDGRICRARALKIPAPVAARGISTFPMGSVRSFPLDFLPVLRRVA